MYIAFEIYRWYDNDFVFTELDNNKDGRISIIELLNYIRATPVLICGIILFNWQLYIWVSILIGEIVTLLIIIGLIGYIYFRDWAMNNFYLSPELLILGNYGIKITLIITILVSFFSSNNPIFSLSVFFFTLIFQISLKIGQYIVINNSYDTIYYFSPFIMPVYSYNAIKQDIVNESELILNIFYLLLLFVLWGCSMAIFYYPIDIGIAIACCFILLIAAIISIAVSYIPMQLAKASTMLTSDSIVECANAAKEMFIERRLPINLEMHDWNNNSNSSGSNINDTTTAVEIPKTPLEKLKDRTALTNAIDLINDIRALKYVKEERINTETNEELEDVDVYELKWYQQLWLDMKTTFKQCMDLILVYTTINTNNNIGYIKHSQSNFNIIDAIMEILILGRGPMGFLGFDGLNSLLVVMKVQIGFIYILKF